MKVFLIHIHCHLTVRNQGLPQIKINDHFHMLKTLSLYRCQVKPRNNTHPARSNPFFHRLRTLIHNSDFPKKCYRWFKARNFCHPVKSKRLANRRLCRFELFIGIRSCQSSWPHMVASTNSTQTCCEPKDALHTSLKTIS